MSAFAFPLPTLPTKPHPQTSPLRRPRTKPHLPRPIPQCTHHLPTPPTTPSPPPTRTPNYYPNLGSVLDSLRDFYPKLLYVEPDLSHYSPNLIFADSTGYRVIGHDAYRAAFWMLRAQARVFLASARIQIQSLYYDDGASAIYLRWRLTASPRWAVVAGASLRAKATIIMDGLCVYSLDEDGCVAMHQLENNTRRRSPLRPMWEEILAVGAVRAGGTPVGVGAAPRVPTWFRTVLEPAEFVVLPEEGVEVVEEIVGSGEEGGGEEVEDDVGEAVGMAPVLSL